MLVSYIGMQTLDVGIKPTVKVVLKSDTQLIDEVIVVAYGTAKKESFTGAASTIKGDQLRKLQSSNLSKSLEGTVAGVQIASSSGQPGDGASIIIRGIGSISASQSPLIVLDGIPYEGSLNSIQSQDIESMTVLKDAAANSMYGARGANGVIIITTKKGKEGKVKVNFEARMGVNSRGVSAYDVMKNTGDYYETYWDAIRNYVGKYGFTPDEAAAYASNNLIDGFLSYNAYKGIANNELVGLDGKLNPNAKELKWTDSWLKEPFKDQIRQEYNANISGASGQTSYYTSFGYLNDKGYIKGSDFERFTIRLKLDQEIGQFVKVGGNIAYARTSQNAPSAGGTNYSNIFMFAQQIAPIYPVYLYDKNSGELILDKNGQKQFDFGDINERPYAAQQNPMATNKVGITKYLTDNINLRGYAEYTFLKDFKLAVNAAYDIFISDNTEFMTPIGGDAASVNGRSSQSRVRVGALNLNELLTWERKFDKHLVELLLGHENKSNNARYIYGEMTNFVDPYNPEFSNAGNYQNLTSYEREYAIEGYFSRAKYNYAERYYVSASFRRDGSSVFHKDNRWGSFWSVGASWRVSQETFMQNVSWLNDLKLKASYGTQGNDNIGYYKGYADLYSVNRVDHNPALSLIFRGNKELTWEKSNNFNVGFETKLFNFLTINADFFIKETKDMLYQSPLPASEGNPNWIFKNEMDMKNTGLEFDITANILNKNNWKWDVSLNGTHYKNELTRLPSDKDPAGYAAGQYWRKKGGSLYNWYMYEYAGVDSSNGKPQYNKYTKDANGVETIELVNTTSNATQRDIGKNPIPKLSGGFSNSIEAYGFDLSIQAAYQLGGYTYDSSYAGFMNGGSDGVNFHKDILNRWTPENTNTNIPWVCYSDQDINGSSDRWLTSASFMSLRNLTLGYTLPKMSTRKVAIESVRFYVTGDNLFFISKRKGFDPRQSFSGSISENYSAMRTISFGASVTF